MERTREFRITIEVYRDTNKTTYRDTETFETYEAATEWLSEQSREEDR